MAFLNFQDYLEKTKKKVGFDRLEKREKGIVIIGGIILVALFFFHFIVSPLVSERAKAQKAIVVKKNELRKIVALQKDYLQVANQVDGIEERVAERSGEFTLFSFIERQATLAKVKEQIKYMKPSVEDGDGILFSSVVDMKLEEVSLVQLVAFLKLVESPVNVVSIGRVSIQNSGKSGGLLDVVMQIVTFMKKS